MKAMNHERGREQHIHSLGRELFERASAATPSFLQGDWWQERILEWTMRDRKLRTQLFRFVDVLPSLRSGAEVAAHLQEYLLDGHDGLPGPLEMALRFGTPGSLAGRIAALAARHNVRRMA